MSLFGGGGGGADRKPTPAPSVPAPSDRKTDEIVYKNYKQMGKASSSYTRYLLAGAEKPAKQSYTAGLFGRGA